MSQQCKDKCLYIVITQATTTEISNLQIQSRASNVNTNNEIAEKTVFWGYN